MTVAWELWAFQEAQSGASITFSSPGAGVGVGVPDGKFTQ